MSTTAYVILAGFATGLFVSVMCGGIGRIWSAVQITMGVASD